jgi:RTX calcium-binding nonapeptide repeat (4 copies)
MRVGPRRRTRGSARLWRCTSAAVGLGLLAATTPAAALAEPTLGADGSVLTYLGDASGNHADFKDFGDGKIRVENSASEGPDGGSGESMPMTVNTPCQATAIHYAECPIAGLTSVAVSMGEGNDAVVEFKIGLTMAIAGGAGNDDAGGGSAGDTVLGEEGDDLVTGDPGGAEGADLVDGGPGNDVVLGGGGDDRVIGGSGDDVLDGDGSGGGAGDDVIDAGDGNDTVYELVGGKDKIKTGAGRDVIEADDGEPGDKINCGPGRDKAVIDSKGDKAGKSCERVKEEND